MAINEELVDELLGKLLEEYKNPEEILGKDGLLKTLTKRIIERALEGEMDHHLGYTKNSTSDKKSKNPRNGKSKKTIKGGLGEIEISIPRDRNSEFEPQIIKKHQTRFDGFDEKIISMYARGMTTRDIQGHLEDIYGVEISPTFISQVTNAVMEDAHEWQNRPLDSIYPIMYLDALRLKIKEDGRIINKAIYLALGVNMEGKKELLGLWIAKNEGAKFWLKVVTDLKNRGVEDIFIACVDGLNGFPEAINSIYPKTEVQLCIVHMVRNSLKYVSYKDYREVTSDLKTIYNASTVEMAEIALDEFGKKWDKKYEMISKTWRKNWENIIPFFAYPDYIRKAIYTTNAIESLNKSMRKVTKNRGSFPNDDAAIKIFYLALTNISKKWTMPIRDWGLALNQFSIIFEDRMPN